MMNAMQYSKWLAQRRAAREVSSKPAPELTPSPSPVVIEPPLSFAQWITRQVDREDSVGVLARDLVGECRRCEREIAAMRLYVDLLWFCDHAPREVHLNRDVGKLAWRQWIRETGG